MSEILNAAAVQAIMTSCFYTPEELKASTDVPPEGAVVVQGVSAKFGLHPGRLEAKRAEIEAMISELDPTISEGLSFLVLAQDRHGELWTGFHRAVEELVVLGVGLGRLRYCLPYEHWKLLPGGLPYVIRIEDGAPAATAVA